MEEWLESVETLVGLDPDHVSFYLLELYPNAPLKDEMARGGWAQAPQDRAADTYHVGVDRLAAAGYAQYEISKAAHAGRPIGRAHV